MLNLGNEIISSARTSLGLSLRQVADCAGISLSSYRDIENDPDELNSVARLGAVRKICKCLKLRLDDVYDLQEEANSEKYEETIGIKRDKLIVFNRKKLELSQEELGDLIGFETISIQEMESDPDFLEAWSFELIKNLSCALRVPVRYLIGFR